MLLRPMLQSSINVLEVCKHSAISHILIYLLGEKFTQMVKTHMTCLWATLCHEELLETRSDADQHGAIISWIWVRGLYLRNNDCYYSIIILLYS